MKKIIVLMLLLALVALSGCQEGEHKQHPTTIQQMKELEGFAQAINQRFATVDNNLLFLYRSCIDPNSN